jgi:PAS domain S-box-containing protein
MVECFGYGKRDLKGESVHALFDNISDKWLKQMHAALRGKAKNRGRELLQTKNGAQWLEWVLVPWYDDHENIIGLILEVEDITTTVVQDNAIMEEAETLRTLIDHLPLNVYIKDKNSKRILANQSEVAFCGYHFEDEVIGKDDYDIFEKDDAQESRMEDIEVMTSMRPIIDRETTIHRKGKPAMTVLSSKIPLRAENGNVIGLVGFSHDISNRMRKEEE